MIVAVMFVGVVALSSEASAADCTITKTLKMGSKGDQVKCLQTALGLTADGSFGKKTKTAVMAFQTEKGLTADGVFGPKARAAWMGVAVVPDNKTPVAGCENGAKYNQNTGAVCPDTTVTQSGPVKVMLASDNPASTYIVGGQAQADLAHFTFSGSGTVSSVVLHRNGVSDQNTLSSVYLYDGVNRLTDGYSFNNNGDLTMNSLGLAISGSKTIAVKADVAASQTASTIGITLVSFKSGSDSVAVNLRGNDMSYGAGNLASVYLATQASVAVPTASVNAGTSAYTVWSAPVQVNTRTVQLKGANFRMVGSAPADALGNIKLYVDGMATGAAATMGTITGSNYAMFDFSASPVSLTTGTHTVDLRADVVKGASYTVTVSVQQASDLVLFDTQLSKNIAPAVSSTVAFTSNAAGQLTINAGSASVVVDPTFQSLTNITGGATNIAIGKFKVHGYGEDVKVSTLSVLPVMANSPTLASGSCTAGTNCSLNNVTVYFNGSQVGSSQNWTGLSSTTLSYTLGSQLILPAGTDSYIEVRADLQNASSVNYTGGGVSANLVLGSSNGQGQSSHSTLNFPTSTVTGTVLTIQTGVLAVSKSTGYADQSVNPNTTAVKIGSFSLQNQSSSESVRVTSLVVTLFNGAGTALTNSTTPALTNFSNLRTSETSGSGANPIQPSATNTFSVDFVLTPGGTGSTKTIDILADTSSATSASIMTKLVVTSIGSNSNVSISQNGTGTAVTGQTITLAVGTVTNPPTLISAGTSAQQFVPAAVTGATNITKATFKIAATGGNAKVSELKFTVNSQDFSSAGTWSAVTTGTGKVFTPTTAAEANRFAVGDSVQVVAATTNGLGTVTAVTTDTSVTVTITVAATGTGSGLRLVPSTVTGIKVGSATVAPVSGVAYLTGLALDVPNGGSGLSQEVFVSYSPVGTNGVASGSTSRVALEYIKYTSGGTTSTLCTAAVGSCGTTMSAGGVSAPTMKLVGSSPVITLVTPVDSAGKPLVLSPGTVEIGDVKVVASKGAITLTDLPISLTLTNNVLTTAGGAANGLVVRDANGTLVTTTNTEFSSTTSGGTSTITFTNGYEIGTSQTFKIYAVINTANFNGSTPVSGSAKTVFGLGVANLLSWTDTAGNASASTGLDVAGSAVTTVSNRYLYSTTTPGFFNDYPTATVGLSS